MSEVLNSILWDKARLTSISGRLAKRVMAQRRRIARLHAGVASAQKRIAELEAALRDVVRDVNDYERVNNLHPNPGRTECWDSVARAKKLITI